MIEINGRPLPVTMFPDNTSQCWNLDEADLVPGSRASVVWSFASEGEFLQLAQLKDLLTRYGVSAELTLKYLPYGRQDKSVDNHATFALQTFARLLNSLDFSPIYIHDPHSDAYKMIRGAYAVYPEAQVLKAVEECEVDVICYPDKGATHKYSQIYGFDRLLHGEKVRDQATGQITSYELHGNAEGKNVLIVDDICDGGATFKILAKDLLAKGAKSVHLFVTHGIFSKGTRTLFDAGITRVFTCDGEVTARSGSQQF